MAEGSSGDSGIPCSVHGVPMFAVNVKNDCPHVLDMDMTPPSSSRIRDLLQSPCVECGDRVENWVCLLCGDVCCSRYSNGHMLQHFNNEGHPIVLSFTDLSVWCYECQSYIHNYAIQKHLEAYRRVLFPE